MAETLLVIDTSTAHAGVSVWKGGRAVYSQTWLATANHTTRLMPAVQRALAETGVSVRGLNAVAVALGPGGFSALRVGISAAKGLTMPLNLPLVGVSTLEAEAYPYAGAGLPVTPLISIGRRETALAGYRRSGGRWQNMRAAEVVANVDLAPALEPGALVCGEGLRAVGGLLREALGCGVALLEWPGPSARLWAVGELAAARLRRGEVDEPASLQPLYLRRPSITPPNPPRIVKR